MNQKDENNRNSRSVINMDQLDQVTGGDISNGFQSSAVAPIVSSFEFKAETKRYRYDPDLPEKHTCYCSGCNVYIISNMVLTICPFCNNINLIQCKSSGM